MHVADQVLVEAFEVQIGGERVGPDAVFPDWSRLDRFGIVVTEPLGGLGASLLLQLAIAKFYSVRPDRRAGMAVYPEIYLFHVVARMATSAISTSGRPGRKYGWLPLSQSRCSRRLMPTGSQAWPCLPVIWARTAFSRPGRVPGQSRRAQWSVCARVSCTPRTVTRPAATFGSRRAIRVSTRTSRPR